MEREAVVRPPLFFCIYIIDRFLLPFIYSYLCQHMIDMINLRAIASVVTMLVGLMSQTAAVRLKYLMDTTMICSLLSRMGRNGNHLRDWR